MKPTQAQIEAAAKAMEHCMFAEHELPLDEELHGKYLETAKAALTAAAEVGDKQWGDNTHSLLGEIIEQMKTMQGEIQNATIERCAQVAESLANNDLPEWASISRQIAAAIRALKDE